MTLSTNVRHTLLAVGAAPVVFIVAHPDYRRVFLSGAGIAQGALVAGIALGVVLTYRGSGVVNLANGAVAMYAAYVYAGLRADGDLFLPPLPNPLSLVEGIVHWFQANDSFSLPDWPTAISFGGSMSFWPSLGIALCVCALLGLVLHTLVFNPLREAPALAKVVGSVGVLLLLEAVVLRRFSSTPRAVPELPFVDKTQIDLGLLRIARDQLFVAGLVAACAFLLWLLYRRSLFGLATRAAAENERGAVVLGYSPALLAGLNWVLSTVITGLLGIFVASVNSNVDPVVITALVVPALTAALVGGFTSFGLTYGAALLLGMQLPLVQYLTVAASWYPRVDGVPIPGGDTLLPLVVIVAVLVARGSGLPQRGALGVSRLPAAPVPPRWALQAAGPALVVATVVASLFVLPPSLRGAATNSAIGVMICLSVVVVTGFAGQLSLAPMAFAGIAAFTVADLSVDRGWPFPLPILAGALIAALVGLVVVLPALRVRGVQLAIVTVALGLVMDRFVFDNPVVNGRLNGAPVARPGWLDQTNAPDFNLLGFLPVGDGKQPNPLTGVFCIAVAAAFCYGVANLRRSRSGRQMLAVRANERAASAAGVNVAATKALAFGLSAFIAGIAGGVMAYRQGGAFKSAFSYDQSLLFFALAYLGGISRVSGAVIGGVLVSGGLAFTIGQELGIPPDFTLLLGGLGLIAMAVAHPEGIAGGLASRLARRGRRQSTAGWIEQRRITVPAGSR